MKYLIFATACVVMCLEGTSCASIVSRSIYPVDFDSEPQGARLTIENRDGRVVYEGRTPATVPLESSSSYMRRENYKVTYLQPGHEPVTTYLEARINGWYFGNLLLGGWIGMLIVDPLTGAMYRIPQYSRTVTIEGEAPPALGPVSATGYGSGSGAVQIHRVPDESEQQWSPLGE